MFEVKGQSSSGEAQMQTEVVLVMIEQQPPLPYPVQSAQLGLRFP